MNIKEFSEKVNQINDRLDSISSLVVNDAPLLKTATMTTLSNSLRNERQRNQLGLIRALFLGESNAGKSTMINALAGKVVVPEVSHTSTLMPTWIGITKNYADEGVVVNYFEINETGEVGDVIKEKRESFDDFRCYYCFKAEDAADPERRIKPVRFKGMQLDEGYMRIPYKEGIMSKYSLTLVDTLGNGATIADDIKAQHNMQDVDFAFVLLGCDGTITESSRNFLASTLFKSRIKPEHIIFVINKIDNAQSPIGSKKNCKESIMSILKVVYGENIPEGLHKKLCNQIIPFSALYNRLVSAGCYPFCTDAKKIYNISEEKFLNPQNEKDIEIVEIALENTEFEERKRRFSDEDLKHDGHFDDLNVVLSNVVNELFVDGTIVNNHLSKPESIAKGFKDCIDARMKAFDADMEAINLQISKFNAVCDKLKTLNTNFRKGTASIINKFPSEINTYLKNNVTQIADVYGTKAEAILSSIDISTETRNKYTTAKELRNLTLTDMQDIFVPEYDVYKEKLVALICDTISSLIFRASKHVIETPYNVFEKKVYQSFNNYITNYVDQIDSINDNGVIKVTTIDKDVFVDYVKSKMHYLTLQLIEKVRKNVDAIIDDSLAVNLKDSIHSWGSLWHRMIHNSDIDYFYNKMNESAKNSIAAAMREKVFDAIIGESGFIDATLSDTIKNNLQEIIPYTTELLSEYQVQVKAELTVLQMRKLEFSSQRAHYISFAKEKLDDPLCTILKEIKDIKQIALDGKIDFS